VKRIVLLCLIIIFTLVCTMPVLANQLSDAQQKQESISRQLDNIYSDKNKIKAEEEKLKNDKDYLQNKENEEKEAYEKLVQEMESLASDIEIINSAVEEAEDNYCRQQELAKTRLRVMYESSESSLLEILLESENFTDFFERLELVSTISKTDKQLIEELKVAKLDVEFKKQLKVEEQNKVRDEASQRKNRLEELVASRSSIESELQRNREQLKKLEMQEDELLKESDRLVNYIKSLQKKSAYAGGSMVWPYPRYRSVSSPFGMRLHPILKVNKMHTGVDIGGTHGDSIVAANSGVVIMSGYSSGYGYNVVIDHGGGITTLYAHSSKLLVGEGTKVKAGDTIAKVGSTGMSTGPHLHFEVRENGVPKNPLDYVSP
jgi:murein DD-endopeptidase MepM/ murein hydrolase activator NlpD